MKESTYGTINGEILEYRDQHEANINLPVTKKYSINTYFRGLVVIGVIVFGTILLRTISIRNWNLGSGRSTSSFVGIKNIIEEYHVGPNDLPFIDQSSFSEKIEEDQLHRSSFQEFKEKYSKYYHDENEESYRFKVYRQNIERISMLNKIEYENGGYVVHGINQFSDLTLEEFSKLASGAIPKSSLNKISSTEASTQSLPQPSVMAKNWAGILTTPVKNQHRCGSCWAFSLVEQIESDSIRLGVPGVSTTTSLSPQQLVDCDIYNLQCDGGISEWSLAWIATNGGLVYEADYPYTSITGDTSFCHVDKSQAVVTVTPTPHSYIGLGALPNYAYTFKSEEDMKNYVLSTGPLSQRIIVSSDLFTYKSGVIHGCHNLSEYGHRIQIVGVNLTDPDLPYWIVRNSWSSNWGEDGYFFIKYGDNVCEIGDGSQAFYTVPTSVATHAPISSPPPTPAAVSRSPSSAPTLSPVGPHGLIWSWNGPAEFSTCVPLAYGQNCVPNNPIFAGLPYGFSTTFTLSLWITPFEWEKSDKFPSYLLSIGLSPWNRLSTIRLAYFQSGEILIYDDCIKKNVSTSVGMVTPGERTHIAVVRSGLEYVYYINGVRDSTLFTPEYRCTYDPRNLALGTYIGGGVEDMDYAFTPGVDYNYQGVMDNVQIFHTALHDDDILHLFNQARVTNQPTHKPTRRPRSKPTLVPTLIPSSPTALPSQSPSQPSLDPTLSPTVPSLFPSSTPSRRPNNQPSYKPSHAPTVPTPSPTQLNNEIFRCYTDVPVEFDGLAMYDIFPPFPVDLHQPFTISFFLTSSGPTKGDSPLLNVGVTTKAHKGTLRLVLDSSGRIGYEDDCTKGVTQKTQAIFNTRERIHFAITRHDKDYQFFVNGEQSEGFQVSNSSCSYKNYGLVVGFDPSKRTFFKGLLDSIQIFNKQLSADTIQSIYDTYTLSPTIVPSRSPTQNPADVPTGQPTTPTIIPTVTPSAPTVSPTFVPSVVPITFSPTVTPTGEYGRIFSAFEEVPKQFDGETTYEQFPALVQPLGDKFSITFFLNTKLAFSTMPLVNQGRSATGDNQSKFFRLFLLSTGMLAYEDDCTNGYYFYIQKIVTLGRRVHIALTKENQVYKCYINDEYIGEFKVKSEGCEYTNTGVTIGYDVVTKTYFKGQLDHVQIFQETLTADQILQIYRKETLSPTLKPTEVPSRTPTKTPVVNPAQQLLSKAPSKSPSSFPTALNGMVYYYKGPISFDGKSTAIKELGSLPYPIHSNFTVRVTIKPYNVLGINPLVNIGRGNGDGQRSFSLILYNGKLAYQDGCTGTSYFTSNKVLYPFLTYEVVFVHVNNIGYFYVDGERDKYYVKAVEGTSSTCSSYDNVNFYIGYDSIFDKYFYGVVKEAMVYKTGLSSEEVKQLHSSSN